MSTRKDSLSELIEHRDAYRMLVRNWAPHLSAVEFKVVAFVIDRTLGWNKEWERITLVHLTKGIMHRGELLVPPPTPSRSKASGALKKLVGLGIVEVRPCGNSKEYKVNIELDMRQPKRKRNPAKGDENGPVTEPIRPCDRTPTGPVTEPLIRGKVNRTTSNKADTKNFDVRSDGEEGDEPEDIAAFRNEIEVQEVESVRRTQKQARRGRLLRDDKTGLRPTKKALKNQYLLWLHEHHPDAPQDVPVVSLAILWNYAETWTLARKEGEFMDYLEWVVGNWHSIRQVVFKWMGDRCPRSPCLRIVTGSWTRAQLEEWHQNQTAFERATKMTPQERDRKFMTEDWGMDPEEVERRLAKKNEEGDQLKLIKEERAKLNIAIAKFEKRRKVKAREDVARTSRKSGRRRRSL